MAKKVKKPLTKIAKGIKRRGTEGVFSKAAKRAGMSTRAYAQAHKHEGGIRGRRARLALTFMKHSK
jgi:hypothetical protein